MSFLVSSKTFLFDAIELTWQLIQLAGSTTRYWWIIATRTLKASWEMKRPTSISSYVALKNRQAADLQEIGFDRAVAHLSRGWAYVEIMFDYTNLFIINTSATRETQIPISLKAKISFFKKHFRTMPELQSYQHRAFAIVDEANRLKLARHDIVHGLALKEAPPGVRRYLRHDYRGKKLIKQTKEYSWIEAGKIASEMFTLGKSMIALLREIGGTDLRSFFEKSDG